MTAGNEEVELGDCGEERGRGGGCKVPGYSFSLVSLSTLSSTVGDS